MAHQSLLGPARLFLRQLKKNADFVKTYVERGWLGMKSSHGFYRYPQPAYQQPDFITSAK